MSISRSQATASSVLVAIKKGHFHLVRELVDRGAAVDEVDGERRTPLMLCSVISEERWSLSIARLLIERGADLSLTDVTGKNALMCACLNERESLARVILASVDFELTAADRAGCTALMHCALTGNARITRLLLQHLLRYDLPVRCAGRDAVRCAAELGYGDVAELVGEADRCQREAWERRRAEADLKRRAAEREARAAQVQAELARRGTESCGEPEEGEDTASSPRPRPGTAASTESQGGSPRKAGRRGGGKLKVNPRLSDILDTPATASADASQTPQPPPDHGCDELGEAMRDEETPITVTGDDHSPTEGPDTLEDARRLPLRPRTAPAARLPPAASTPRGPVTVLKQARERQLTAKRQDLRRALSALPNRKRVRESKISFQVRRNGSLYTGGQSRPATGMSHSLVITPPENTRDESCQSTLLLPIFAIYREQLTPSFRLSVHTLQRAETARLAALDGGPDEQVAERASPSNGRDSTDSKRAANKSKKKTSTHKKPNKP